MENLSIYREMKYALNFLLGKFDKDNARLAHDADDADALDAVIRLTRGNIPIQFGDFEDSGDLEQARSDIADIELP